MSRYTSLYFSIVARIFEKITCQKFKSHFHLKLIDSKIFRRFFICFNVTTNIFYRFKRFMSINNIFLINKFVITLLLTIEIDINDKMTIFAWNIVKSKNFEFWKYFFDHVKLIIFAFKKQFVVLIFNRNKELKKLHVKLNVEKNMLYIRCYKYIKINLLLIFRKFILIFEKTTSSKTTMLQSLTNNIKK